MHAITVMKVCAERGAEVRWSADFGLISNWDVWFRALKGMVQFDILLCRQRDRTPLTLAYSS